MDFGKLDDIDGVDFSLPPDDKLTDKLWESLELPKKTPLKIFIGCTRWGSKNWVGKVYPRGTKDKDFLAHYVKQFNTIELNSLFHSLQPKQVIERWALLADPEFRFCPKFSNTISHLRQLRNAERDTDLFIDHMQSFGGVLGPCFLQLSDGFKPDRATILQDWLRQLPRDFSTCVAVRHEGWFRDVAGTQQAVSDTWELLREQGIGTVITDTSGRRDCLHMKLTAPMAFIRFVGNNGHPTDFSRIDTWVDRLKTWIDKGLRQIYFFIHNHEEFNSPELCKYTVEQFNKKCATKLNPPRLIDDDKPVNFSLF